MKFDYTNETTGKSIPVTIELERVDPRDLFQFMTNGYASRNSQCLQGKPCAKYGERPCCPPKLKLLTEFPIKKYMYLIMVRMDIEDYFVYSPKTKESPRRHFLFNNIGHMTTRNIVNRTVSSFDGQAFRVGGCLGCTYTKDQKCKRFMPPLEGTGLDLHEVVKSVFGIEIDWTTKDHHLTTMTSLGGLMTDEKISKQKFTAAIMKACNY